MMLVVAREGREGEGAGKHGGELICSKMGIRFGWMRSVVVLGVAVEASGVCVVSWRV